MADVAVRYFSKSGHTKVIAMAIAGACDTVAESVPVPVDVHVDVLFIGSSVYWAGIPSEIKDYILSLDPEKIGKAVVFSTSGLAQRAFPQFSDCFKKIGITVEKDNFYCRGEFAGLHKGHPDAADAENAAAFAKRIICGDSVS